MEHTATAAFCPTSPDDPQPDPPGRTIPARIAALLHTVRIMLGFGRHLAETAKDRSASPDFNAIAACFGTSRVYAILAHLQRGLLRATALENVLLARAAQGRDIRFTAPRKPATATLAAPADAPAADQPAETPAEAPVEQPAAPVEQPADPPAEAPIARKASPSRPHGWNDPELFMPTLEELEAQVRRRPLGRTLVDICLDLAVVPGFCTGPFWNTLFDSIDLLGGNVGTLMQEKARRQEAFCEEQDRKPGSNWDWLEMGRDALRRVLGFCIGEVANDAFDPIAQPYAPATAVAPDPS
jgi:type IV secretory pathway VirB10-like protein